MQRLVFLLLLCFSLSAFSQNEKFKSVFVYNFTKYISWPKTESEKSFQMGLIGKSLSLLDELKQVAGKSKVGNRPIVVKEVAASDELSNYQILIITDSESSRLKEVLAKVKGKPVLVITNSPGLAQAGACINFVEIDGKLKFEVNKRAVESQGLEISASLVNFGILIEPK